jgi:phosphonate transport system substrate-binding protein
LVEQLSKRHLEGGKMLTRRYFLGSSIALTLFGFRGSVAAASSALSLGTLPVVSTRTAYEIYQPLISHLETVLQRKVELETPPNFKVMYQQILDRRFDILVSPPHIARLAQKKFGWQPLATCQPEHNSVLMVMEANGPPTLEDLRGKTIAILDKSALVAMIMIESLAQKGLLMERDYKVIETRSYESSQIAVRQGVAEAMVARSQGFIDPNERERMKVLFEAGALPGYVMIASPAMGKKEVQQLRKDLLVFGGTDDAKVFLKKLGYDGLAPPSEEALKRLDPYLGATESSLR